MHALLLVCALVCAADEVPAFSSATIPGLKLSGTVTTSTGEPIASAHVIVRTRLDRSRDTPGRMNEPDILDRMQTNAAGQFAFDHVVIPLRFPQTIEGLNQQEESVEVIAWAEGRAVAWTRVAGFAPRSDIQLRLGPQADAMGVIRDEDGKPVARATIVVWGITPERQRISAFYNGDRDLNLNRSEFSLAVVSDGEGRFRISHLPADQRITLAVEGPTIVRQTMMLDTAAKPDRKEIRFRDGGKYTMSVVTSPVDISVKRQRSFVVKVTDHNGKSVVGGTVQATGGMPFQFPNPAEVNEEGIAVLPLTANGKWTVRYYADPRHPRLGAKTTIEVMADEQPAEVSLRLAEHRWLNGRASIQ